MEIKEAAMETKVQEETKVPEEAEVSEEVKLPEEAAGNEIQEARIYIGPTQKGLAIAGTVYNGDLPPALNEAIRITPVLGELVVPISQLVEANKKLADQNSALNKFYELAGKQEGRTK